MEINSNQTYIVSTDFLLNKMMGKNYFSYDVFFRMAIIDEYLKGNEKIWELYTRVQSTRAKQIPMISYEMINHKSEFIRLIENMKKYGYDFQKPILVNKNLYVIDGAHRMACALKFNLKEVSIYTKNEFINFTPNEYTKNWFINNNLSACIPYAEKQKELVKGMMKNV